MERPFVVLAICLLGAVVASVVVTLSLAESAPSGPAEPGPAQVQLVERLGGLEEHLRQLETRLRDVELRPIEPSRAAEPEPLGGPGAVDLGTLDERLASLESALRVGDGQPAPSGGALLTEVGAAVEALRQQEQAARDAERDERREEREAERLAELSEALGLEAWQQLEVGGLLEGAQVERDILRDAFDVTGDRDAMRDGMRALEAEMKQQAELLLTPDQLTKLEELGGLEAFGGGAGGRGGRQGGGGRRGR